MGVSIILIKCVELLMTTTVLAPFSFPGVYQGLSTATTAMTTIVIQWRGQVPFPCPHRPKFPNNSRIVGPAHIFLTVFLVNLFLSHCIFFLVTRFFMKGQETCP